MENSDGRGGRNRAEWPPRDEAASRGAGRAALRMLAVSLDSRLGGGMPAVARGLVDEVGRRGIDIRLLESRLGLPEDGSPELAHDGTTYLIAAPGAVLHDPKDVLRDCGNLYTEHAFAAVLDDWDPDLVFFVHTAGLGMSLVHVARQRQLPAIVYVGDYYLLCPLVKMFHKVLGACQDPMGGLGCSRCTTGHQQLAPAYNFRLNFALDVLRRGATVVDAQSEAVRRVLLRFGVPGEKIRVLSPGIQGGRIMPRKRRQRGEPIAFGFVGNAGFPKGCHLLVEAFLRLPAERASLILYGGGESGYVEPLRRQGEGRVRFAGEFHPAQLPAIMSQIDVGVVPSLWEECGPLVVSEFLHHGVPVIGFDIGGIPEQMVPGQDGFLVPAGDSQRLTDAMGRFIREPDLLERMPSRGRRIKTFGDWAEEIIEIGRELVGEAGIREEQASGVASQAAGGTSQDFAGGNGGRPETAPEGERAGGSPGPSAAVAEVEGLKSQGRLKECANKAEDLLRQGGLGPRESQRLRLLAGECLAKSGDLDCARDHFKKGLASDPEDFAFLVAAGALELAAGHPEKAVELFGQACQKVASDDRALCGLGLSLSQCGNMKEGFERLEAALAANPSNLTALCGLTSLAYRLEKVDLLEARLRTYLDHHPGNPDILYSLAGCLLHQGRRGEARSELDKVLLLCPDHELALDLIKRIEGEAAAQELSGGLGRKAACSL